MDLEIDIKIIKEFIDSRILEGLIYYQNLYDEVVFLGGDKELWEKITGIPLS